MKIDRPVSPLVNPVPNKKAAEKLPTKTETTEQTQTNNLVSARSKIVNWFAKAGIGSKLQSVEEKSVSKRMMRHQSAKAQRKLLNLEKILGLSLEYSLEQGKPDDIDPDWFFSFIELAESIHSPPMQELWAKIFSVEISRPGTFSLRSLQTLKQLTQKDAKIFKLAVNMASRKKGDYGPCLIYGYYQKPGLLSFIKMQPQHQLNLAQYGLSYPDILALMDLGLIYSSEIESGEWDTVSRTQWRCGNQIFHLAANRRGLALNYYKFTATGSELSKLVSGSPNAAYLEALKQTLSGGFEVT